MPLLAVGSGPWPAAAADCQLLEHSQQTACHFRGAACVCAWTARLVPQRRWTRTRTTTNNNAALCRLALRKTKVVSRGYFFEEIYFFVSQPPACTAAEVCLTGPQDKVNYVGFLFLSPPFLSIQLFPSLTHCLVPLRCQKKAI